MIIEYISSISTPKHCITRTNAVFVIFKHKGNKHFIHFGDDHMDKIVLNDLRPYCSKVKLPNSLGVVDCYSLKITQMISEQSDNYMIFEFDEVDIYIDRDKFNYFNNSFIGVNCLVYVLHNVTNEEVIQKLLQKNEVTI